MGSIPQCGRIGCPCLAADGNHGLCSADYQIQFKPKAHWPRAWPMLGPPPTSPDTCKAKKCGKWKETSLGFCFWHYLNRDKGAQNWGPAIDFNTVFSSARSSPLRGQPKGGRDSGRALGRTRARKRQGAPAGEFEWIDESHPGPRIPALGHKRPDSNPPEAEAPTNTATERVAHHQKRRNTLQAAGPGAMGPTKGPVAQSLPLTPPTSMSGSRLNVLSQSPLFAVAPPSPYTKFDCSLATNAWPSDPAQQCHCRSDIVDRLHEKTTVTPSVSLSEGDNHPSIASPLYPDASPASGTSAFGRASALVPLGAAGAADFWGPGFHVCEPPCATAVPRGDPVAFASPQPLAAHPPCGASQGERSEGRGVAPAVNGGFADWCVTSRTGHASTYPGAQPTVRAPSSHPPQITVTSPDGRPLSAPPPSGTDPNPGRCLFCGTAAVAGFATRCKKCLHLDVFPNARWL